MYRIYSRINSPAYKPTPFPTALSLIARQPRGFKETCTIADTLSPPEGGSEMQIHRLVNKTRDLNLYCCDLLAKQANHYALYSVYVLEMILHSTCLLDATLRLCASVCSVRRLCTPSKSTIATNNYVTFLTVKIS